MASRIAQIVDYTALVAARIKPQRIPSGYVEMRAVFGTGQVDPDTGEPLYQDPLHPGQPLQPAPENPLEPYTHFSDLPDAPGIEWLDQEGDVALTWDIPMRFWFPRSDLAMARQTAMPFYAAYLSEFHKDYTLGGLCKLARVSRYAIGGDEFDSWLDVNLSVLEEVALYDE